LERPVDPQQTFFENKKTKINIVHQLESSIMYSKIEIEKKNGAKNVDGLIQQREIV
jgi:hypothetical protein